jgi:two-component sensor histidine kinase
MTGMKPKFEQKRCETELERVIRELSSLFFEAERNKDFKTRFQNPNLLKCWEHTDCPREKCPAYGSENLRCWQIAGTHCGEKIVGTRARLLDDCKECEVFKGSTSDPTSEVGELFNNMMFVLGQRMDQIKEAERGLERRVEDATRLLKESQSQLIHQEKMASIGLLASGIAHEVGNPLTSISSLVQLIQRKPDAPVSQERLDLIRKHINRISEIVRELADFARPSQGGVEKINVNEVLQSAIEFLKYSKKAKGIELISDLEEDLSDLVLVRDQLLQVFMNLILNAVDAMKDGGVLTVRTQRVGHRIRVDFKDTGLGIPPEIKKKIFGIQTSTDGTVAGVTRISEVVNEINDVVSGIATAVEQQAVTTKEIASNVAQTFEGISEINENVAQSSTGSSEIAAEIADVTHAAGTIASSSTQVSRSAGELSNMADQLNRIVEKFKV